MIYLDHAASSPLDEEVASTLCQSLREDYANPGAQHVLGRGLHQRIEEARLEMLQALGGREGEGQLLFTASATESNNLFIQGLGLPPTALVVGARGDHPSLVGPLSRHQKLEWKDLGPETRLVALSAVNSQSGQLLDLSLLPEIKERAPGAVVLIDGVQAVGKIPAYWGVLKRWGQWIDGLSFASHKLGGPKGIAGLYLSKRVKLVPQLLGGGQEGGLRSSTVAAPLVFAFAHALRRAKEGHEAKFQRALVLNARARELLQEVGALFPFTGELSPFILSFLLPPVSSDIMLRHLEEKHIILSSTSACSSKNKGPNPTLTALGIALEKQRFMLRASFGHQTTLAEVEAFAAELKRQQASLSALYASSR